MTFDEYMVKSKKRDEELKNQGIACEFDGPVSKQFQDELLADFRKDLEKTLEEIKQQAA
jgi:hypothetical protein